MCAAVAGWREGGGKEPWEYCSKKQHCLDIIVLYTKFICACASSRVDGNKNRVDNLCAHPPYQNRRQSFDWPVGCSVWLLYSVLCERERQMGRIALGA